MRGDLIGYSFGLELCGGREAGREAAAVGAGGRAEEGLQVLGAEEIEIIGFHVGKKMAGGQIRDVP